MINGMPHDVVHADDRMVIEVLGKLRCDYWIAGGTVLNWYLGRPADSDIDLFFRDQTSFDRMRQALEKVDDIQWTYGTYRPRELSQQRIAATDNAITYRLTIDTGKGHDYSYDVQLIRRSFYATARELVDDFDITVCQVAWDGKRLIASDSFAGDVANRRLRISRIGPNTTKRFVKYWTYGYQPCDADVDMILNATDQNLQAGKDDY